MTPLWAIKGETQKGRTLYFGEVLGTYVSERCCCIKSYVWSGNIVIIGKKMVITKQIVTTGLCFLIKKMKQVENSFMKHLPLSTIQEISTDKGISLQ